MTPYSDGRSCGCQDIGLSSGKAGGHLLCLASFASSVGNPGSLSERLAGRLSPEVCRHESRRGSAVGWAMLVDIQRWL